MWCTEKRSRPKIDFVPPWSVAIDPPMTQLISNKSPSVPSIYTLNYCLPQSSERDSSRTSRCWWRYLDDEAESMTVYWWNFPYAENKNPSSIIRRMGSRNEQEQKSSARSSLPNHCPFGKMLLWAPLVYPKTMPSSFKGWMK